MLSDILELLNDSNWDLLRIPPRFNKISLGSRDASVMADESASLAEKFESNKCLCRKSDGRPLELRVPRGKVPGNV